MSTLSKDRQPGQVLAVDDDKCIACGICYSNPDDEPKILEETDDGKSKAIVIPAAKYDEDEDLVDKAQDAIESCPVVAIGWTTSPAA
jgi:ferredoxin